MSDRTVCEIKPSLYFCLLFGYYDPHPSIRIRLLAKLYCLLLLEVNTMVYYYIGMSFIPWHLLFISYFEYISIALISLTFKFKPISSLSRIVRKVIPIILIVETIFVVFVYCDEFGAPDVLIVILYITSSLATHIGMLPIMLTCLLFYCRVKIMREILVYEINGFNNTPRCRFQPRRYVQMYETLMNTLKNTNLFVSLTGTIVFSCSLVVMFSELFFILCGIQDTVNVMMISFACISLVYIVVFNKNIISAILSDLVKNNLQKIMVTVIEKRINCKNERERDEIQTLYQLMQTRPYVYTLANVIPLQLSSLLSYISYMITTLIAILQIKRLAF